VLPTVYKIHNLLIIQNGNMPDSLIRQSGGGGSGTTSSSSSSSNNNNNNNNNNKTRWSESASELHRPSDRRLSAK
jgi:hypothetical protein